MIEYVNFQNDVRFIADDEDGDCMAVSYTHLTLPTIA